MENVNPPMDNPDENLSVISKMIQIFSNPGRVFQNLSSYMDWLVPLIVLVAFTLIRSFIMHDMEIEMVKDKIVQNEQIPEESKAQILAKIDEDSQGTGQIIRTVGGSIIAIFVFALIVAGLYLFTGNVIMGGTANYTQLLSVYALGSLVFIPEHIVKVSMALTKGSPKVYTSLALLFDPEQSQTLLFQLANAIDVFSLWKLALWALGFGIVYKFNQTKSWVAVGVWYVVGILIFYGLNVLTGGMLG